MKRNRAATQSASIAARPGSDPQTQISVIEKCRMGDESAWETFFSVYGPVAYRLARRAGLSDFDAQDVVANVMRKMLNAFRGGFEVDYQRGRFRHYLKRIVRNEIAEHFRAKKLAPVDPQESAPVEAPDDSAAWREVEQSEFIRACFDRLRQSPNVRPRDLLVFERYAMDQEPVEKVAREAGISTSRVYAIKHEIIGELRRMQADLDANLE